MRFFDQIGKELLGSEARLDYSLLLVFFRLLVG